MVMHGLTNPKFKHVTQEIYFDLLPQTGMQQTTYPVHHILLHLTT